MKQDSRYLLDRRSAIAASLAAGGLALVPAGCGGDSSTPSPAPPPSTTPSLNPYLAGDLTPVHDPCAVRAADNNYYVYCTYDGSGAGQIPIRRSLDLKTWQKIGYVFSAVPAWATTFIPSSGGIWAPDISYVNGKYLLYYACSGFGQNVSAIGLATNTTLDPAAAGYAWQDDGMVIQSSASDNFNAIDPNHIVDSAGQHWLAFGSFWSGLKMIPLDAATGKRPAGDNRIFSLASRPSPDAIEAPFVIQRDNYYYLFAAFDYCCRGANSTYYTVVSRCQTVTGPYLGSTGTTDASTFPVVLANDTTSRWRGPGGASILTDGSTYYIVYHAYDASNGGVPTLRIAPLVWSADGWPSAAI